MQRIFLISLLLSTGALCGCSDRSEARSITGWYCQLYYKGGHRSAEWDPNTQSALHVGVGNCNYLVAAIDNEDDLMIYVGPAYSYYEFLHPAEDRLTDPAWQERLQAHQEPDRPIWIKDFQAERVERHMGNPAQR